MGPTLNIVPAKWLDWRPPSECWDFGIGELLATSLPALFATDASIAAGGALAPSLGASVLGSALPGAALGAGESALTGGKPLIGALTGGATGGAIGAAGSLAPELGISPTLAKTVAGAGTGFLGSELTGQNPILGTLGGGAAGFGSGLLNGGASAGADIATAATGTAAVPAAGPAVPSATPTSAALLSTDGDFGSSLGAPGSTGGGPNGTLLSSVGSPAPLTGDLGNASGNAATGGGNEFGGYLNSTGSNIPNLSGETGNAASGGNSGRWANALSSTGGTGGNVATGGTSSGAAASGQGNWLSDTLGTTGKTDLGSRIATYIGDNPTLPIGAGLLGTSLFMGSGKLPQSAALGSNAASLTRLGNEGISSLQTGRVPAGAQSVLDQTKSALDAKTRSNYASLGLGGSTMEAQALNQNAQTVEASKWKIINDLVTTGTGALKDASTIDYQLMQAEIAKDQRTQDAIARFAAALAGSASTTRKAQ